MYIAIDFDGTCVTHEYPNIGRDIGAVSVLKELVNAGHKLILFTMRSNIQDVKGNGAEIIDCKAGNYLDDAVKWFNDNSIELFGVNVNPTQKDWTTSPKAYAHLYIDDAAIGIPLNAVDNGRPYVEWVQLRRMLVDRGILPGVVPEHEPRKAS